MSEASVDPSMKADEMSDYEEEGPEGHEGEHSQEAEDESTEAVGTVKGQPASLPAITGNDAA